MSGPSHTLAPSGAGGGGWHCGAWLPGPGRLWSGANLYCGCGGHLQGRGDRGTMVGNVGMGDTASMAGDSTDFHWDAGWANVRVANGFIRCLS